MIDGQTTIVLLQSNTLFKNKFDRYQRNTTGRKHWGVSGPNNGNKI